MLLAAIAVTAAVLLTRVYLRRRSERGNLPGPTLGRWPVLEWLPALISVTRPRAGEGVELFDFFLESARRNKFKTWAYSFPWQTEIVVSSPENVKHVMNTKFETCYVLGETRRSVFHTMLGDGIFNSDGEKWKTHRRGASHLFSARRLRHFMTTVFKSNAEVLKDILAQRVGKEEPVDIQSLFYRYTFDSFMALAFGREAKTLSGDVEGLACQRNFDRASVLTNLRFTDLFWQVKQALNVGTERELGACMAAVDRYVYAGIDGREDAVDEENADLLTLFVEECAASGQQYTDEDLRDLVVNFVLAGRDTTAAVSTWMIWELSRHPDVRKRCEDEVKATTAVTDMEYLQAVFQETLRLHPSVPLDFKECVKDDVLPDGTKVKAGVLVGFHPLLTCRNPAIFEDPETFNPDRWMDGGKCKSYDEYSYPCFNAGPRVCLGRHMASLEAKTVIAELLSELQIDVVPGFRPQISMNLVKQSQNGLSVLVKPRGEAVAP
eukprot:TRINITY_DN1486_c0_g1_i1.p1 TRINITY_DN1486_c0_g1~~TRINITY_DN1486_c0_g1_i1.p1  ORF type:complete len:493 (+),score=205.72 TRINITY_DN1486_c0_g1_i1:102-1580(+)